LAVSPFSRLLLERLPVEFLDALALELLTVLSHAIDASDIAA
jgi:hypothetical protein